MPDRPGAWLTTTAWRKALDAVRRDRSAPGSAVEGPVPAAPEPGLHQEDDLLQLVLICCHPALAVEARVALTLRHVAGLSVAEIAAGFLVAEETMAKRLVRARTKIRQTAISFELPGPEGLAERLSSVQAVLYLVFTEGHLASGDGPAVRGELCDEAIWLARQVHRLLPDDAETTGLLALMLLQHSRADARHDDAGRLLTFAEQDRARWDHRAITEARALLGTTGRAPVGPYQVQAAIAALHAAATSADDVNWPRIADLYGLLARIAPSPVVTVNRAVAVGRADGPRAALASSSPCWPTGGWPTTRRCTPPTPTCSSAPGTPRGRWRPGGGPPSSAATPPSRPRWNAAPPVADGSAGAEEQVPLVVDLPPPERRIRAELPHVRLPAVPEHQLLHSSAGSPAPVPHCPRRGPGARRGAAGGPRCASTASRSGRAQSTCRQRTTSTDAGGNGGSAASARATSTRTPAVAALARARASICADVSIPVHLVARLRQEHGEGPRPTAQVEDRAGGSGITATSSAAQAARTSGSRRPWSASSSNVAAEASQASVIAGSVARGPTRIARGLLLG